MIRGEPLIVPPSLFERLRHDPRFSARCASGDIRANQPIPIPLNLGGATIGLQPQPDGSMKIVP